MYVPNQENPSANYLHGLMICKEIKGVVVVERGTTEEEEEVEEEVEGEVEGEAGEGRAVWIICFLLELLKLNNRNVC